MVLLFGAFDRLDTLKASSGPIPAFFLDSEGESSSEVSLEADSAPNGSMGASAEWSAEGLGAAASSPNLC